MVQKNEEFEVAVVWKRRGTRRWLFSSSFLVFLFFLCFRDRPGWPRGSECGCFSGALEAFFFLFCYCCMCLGRLRSSERGCSHRAGVFLI